jgi:hypothetical protein
VPVDDVVPAKQAVLEEIPTSYFNEYVADISDLIIFKINLFLLAV